MNVAVKTEHTCSECGKDLVDKWKLAKEAGFRTICVGTVSLLVSQVRCDFAYPPLPGDTFENFYCDLSLRPRAVVTAAPVCDHRPWSQSIALKPIWA